MSASPPEGPTRGTYHHGDLRRALVDAALTILRAEGYDALTLRAVARSAGVSHAAPYHHFADKGALIEVLAIEGHHRLCTALASARAPYAAAAHTPDPLAALRRIGAAYVTFALTEPELFRLMNRTDTWGLRGRTPVELRKAVEATWTVLVDAVCEAQGAGLVVAGEAREIAFALRSVVHGLVFLLLDGQVEGVRPDPADAAPLLGLVLTSLGVGIIPRPTPARPANER